ncbi:sarcosine oxidase subunit gamma [Glutamicibacter sp. JC586]|uniref:sarcosine oxidase subunit gamma n=1 Tax=Glutamicibacter sp. JC586 TaxID=2590552 RepID=UPI00135C0258|nr:sarcosine oxidase subunit gamma family protein [Glutamicibacter sp. JC586]
MANDTLIKNETRVSPAAHLYQEMADASVPGALSLSEVAFSTKVSVRCAPGSAGFDAVATATGVGLPHKVGEVRGEVDTVAVLWLGPDEFLVAAPEDAQLAAKLDQTLGENPGQVVDLSANRSVLELTGAKAPLVLRKSCPADLHPRAFAVNHAITTSLANIPVLLWRTGEESWRIMPRASFTEHTVRWLIDAMIEFRTESI